MSRSALRALVAAAIALAALVGIALAASAAAPRAVASTAELDAQRTAGERAVQRIYAAGLEQLKTTRSLKLAITDAQAAAIETKYADQLKGLRRSALQALGVAVGMSADAATQYAQQAEPRLDSGLASAPPVLLAPKLYQIVEKMGVFASQVTDQGIKEMTQSTPAPTASPSTTPRPTPSASPSPTGR